MTKIAIIEDHQQISLMYRMKFEAAGFEVELADNGKLGVELVEKFQPDIILLDLQMPEMGGTEALKIMRSHDWGKNIPVIILTNMGEDQAPKELEALNVKSYIVKADLTPSQVVAKVKQTLGV